MYGQPVGRQHAEARAQVEGQPVVAGELHATDPAHHVETTVHGEIATEKYLARQEVVAQREAVVRETSLISGQQLDVAAQRLEAGLSGGGLAQIGPEEEIFCHMVGELPGIGRVGTKILDGNEAGAHADLPILIVDLGCLYLATSDVGLDD